MQKETPIWLVTALIHNESKQVLLLRRANNPFKGLWSIPGGKVNIGESAKDAISREMNEELGINLKTYKQLGEETYTSPGYAHVFIYTANTTAEDTITPNPTEVSEVAWVDKNSLSELEPFPPNHAEVLSKYLK